MKIRAFAEEGSVLNENKLVRRSELVEEGE
jgi:hypothetical protein